MPDPVTPAELAALLNQPPEKAVEFFRAKGLALTWNWHDQWRDTHSRAFTVAKLARIDILQDIYNGVQQALASGESEAAFKARMGALLQQRGWWGKKIVVGADGQAEVVQEGSPRRLSTIYRTNLQSAYMSGRWQQFAAEADQAPYVQYIAVMDGRTRPSHARFNGKVFRIDSPAWKVIAPPNGFNCRCRIRNLDARELAARGLKVEGDVQVEQILHDPLVDARTGKWADDTAVQRGISIPEPTRPGRRITLWADRGWDYNPGEAGLEHIEALAARKIARAAPEIRAAAMAADHAGVGNIGEFAGQAMRVSDRKVGISLGMVENADRIKHDTGFDLSGYERILDNYGVRHTIKQHGNAKAEESRGQIAVTLDDFVLIPLIVSDPDNVFADGKNKIGRDVIVFTKIIDGIGYRHVEEIRPKGKLVATDSLRKKMGAWTK